MKAIINEKLYDTLKAEKIYSFCRRVDKGPVWWDSTRRWRPFHNFDLYRTLKGNYFEHDTEDNTIEPISFQKAASVVKHLNPDKYMELFDMAIEEA